MLDRVKSLAMIILGNFILVFGVAMFILPYDILSGGVAGVVIAISPLVSFNRELMIDGLTVILFFAGWLFLGKEFGLKTLVSTICYPIFLNILTPIVPVIDIDPAIASIYGGVICGIGVGLVMREGASTGGMDIPPLVLHKIIPVKLSTLVMIIDALTVLLGIATYGIASALIGLFSVFTTGYAIDKVLSFGGTESRMIWIISDRFEDINERILLEMNRGVTLVDGIGGFTKENKKVLMCAVNAREYKKVLDIVNAYDQNAFVITTNAIDVRGEGFSLGFKV